MILSSTLSVGIAARWPQPTLMPAPGSLSSPIAASHPTRSTPIRAALERYLRFLKTPFLVSTSVTRGDVGLYLASLQAGRSRLSNATIQQLLTVVRLFHAYLMEEGVRPNNPAAQSRQRTRDSGAASQAALDSERGRLALGFLPRHARSRFATDSCWRSPMMPACGVKNSAVSERSTSILRDARSGFGRRPPRDAANELFHTRLQAVNCSSIISSIGVRWARSAVRSFFQSRAATTPSRSRSGVGRRLSCISRDVPALSVSATHTFRHLCLTDLARAGWDIHEIATFAGHRSIQTTLLYIHLSGRDLSAKLAASMAQIHARRIQMLAEMTGEQEESAEGRQALA